MKKTLLGLIFVAAVAGVLLIETANETITAGKQKENPTVVQLEKVISEIVSGS